MDSLALRASREERIIGDSLALVKLSRDPTRWRIIGGSLALRASRERAGY